ncbi:MAG: dipeptidase [Bosea sp.]|jgi:acetylornithine deacetylase/succinyl-diaminopimelate desuccinylase-like protein|nr:dipeptidase [Bosea sp. (in: a-proteobacteria)]
MSALQPVLARLDADREGALARLMEWLRIPSISTDSAYKADSARAADWLVRDLAELGFKASARPTPGHPIVLGHRPRKGAPHVLFYGHYDVQPVDPLSLWHAPPFEPRIAEIEPGRHVITGRGACDDKGQVMTFIEACRAWLAETGDLPVGVTILVEGEEESGSLNLPAFIEANQQELAADVALVCDTGMWDRHTPAITAALRGLVYMEVKITAADRDLHSGLFGGAAANPIRVLTKVLAGLHDDNGKVTLPGFYDGVHELPAQIKAAWAGLGLTPEDFLGQVGLRVPAGERDRLLIEMIQSRPTCDVNGIWGGYQGEGTKTVIASEACAKVSFRLVGDQDPEAIIEAFEAYVRARIPADCRADFIRYKGSRAISLDWDMPALAKAEKALTEEWGRPAAIIGSGGSIPVVGDFKRTLGIDTLLVGFGLDDDRVHSPNEKYDLSSFQKGARSWARILAALGAPRP